MLISAESDGVPQEAAAKEIINDISSSDCTKKGERPCQDSNRHDIHPCCASPSHGPENICSRDD